jgi:hypothetical protein
MRHVQKVFKDQVLPLVTAFLDLLRQGLLMLT